MTSGTCGLVGAGASGFKGFGLIVGLGCCLAGPVFLGLIGMSGAGVP